MEQPAPCARKALAGTRCTGVMNVRMMLRLKLMGEDFLSVFATPWFHTENPVHNSFLARGCELWNRQERIFFGGGRVRHP